MSPAVALYGHWTCPFVHRVAWALAERGIDHDRVDVPPSAVRPNDFVLPPEFVAHSPRLEIPMVRVGEEFLVDSIPILFWLEDAVSDALGLLPEASEVLVRGRMGWIDEHVFRAMVGVCYGTDDVRIARSSAALCGALDEVATWLVDHDWLSGPAPTLTDAVFVPFLVRLDALGALGFEGEVPPAIEAYGDRVRAGRGWEAVAWTSAQIEELVGRVLARRRLVRRGMAP